MQSSTTTTTEAMVVESQLGASVDDVRVDCGFRPVLESVKGMRWRSGCRDAYDLFLNILSLEPECPCIEFQRFSFRNGFEIDLIFLLGVCGYYSTSFLYFEWYL